MPRDRTFIGAAAVVAALLIPGLPSPVTVPVGSGAVRAQSQHDGAIVPFKIAVPDAVLTDLKERLARTRFPSEIEGSGWDYGTNLAYLRELVTYWRTKYDWREQERRLNQWPQFTTNIDGVDLHFIHQRSSRSDATPLKLRVLGPAGGHSCGIAALGSTVTVSPLTLTMRSAGR